MPNRVTGMLMLLFTIAATCFSLGLLALGRGNDLLAVLLCGAGGLSLRALSQAARVAERGGR